MDEESYFRETSSTDYLNAWRCYRMEDAAACVTHAWWLRGFQKNNRTTKIPLEGFEESRRETIEKIRETEIANDLLLETADPQAQEEMFEDPRNYDDNSRRADVFFRRACLLGDAEGCRESSIFTGAHYTKLLKSQCKKGDGLHCFWRWEELVEDPTVDPYDRAYNKEVEKYLDLATTHLTKECEGGDSTSCFELGNLKTILAESTALSQIEDEGELKPAPEAVEEIVGLYKKACNLGHSTSCFFGATYGKTHQQNFGDEEFLNMMTKGCTGSKDGGHLDACKAMTNNFLGDAFDSKKVPEEEKRKSLLEQAMMFASKACELGSWTSCMMSSNYKKFGHPAGSFGSQFEKFYQQLEDEFSKEEEQQQLLQQQQAKSETEETSSTQS